jgi:hypothetical protein
LNCGAGWVRLVKSVVLDDQTNRPFRALPGREEGDSGNNKQRAGDTFTETIGWEPGCKCTVEGVGGPEPYPTGPATILDPFFGSGTTGRVANKFGRKAIGIELNRDYLKIIEERTARIQTAFELSF